MKLCLLPRIGLTLFSLTAATFIGCGIGPAAAPTPQSGAAIRGSVIGGQQPVVGAHVYLMGIGSGGYGGYGIAASPANASVSLLQAAKTGHSDFLGAYVLTDSRGFFTITGDYTCGGLQQVYLYAVGGNPGGGSNSASGFLAYLGSCPFFTGALSPTLTVWMNEVSTAATAVAFAGFATDPTHISGSSGFVTLTNMQNAAANTANPYPAGQGLLRPEVRVA